MGKIQEISMVSTQRFQLRVGLLLAVAVLACGAQGEAIALEPGGSDNDDELLGESESILSVADHAKLEYSMFSGVAGGTLADKAPHYIRHMGDSAMMTTASSDDDKRDTTWRIKPPLCAPGTDKCPQPLEENPKCVSFESANWAGYYLMHKDARIVLSKPSAESRASATFCRRPGLADQSKISFESLNKKGYFLRHYSFKLFICDNTNKGGCGKTSLEKFRQDSTFERKKPEFFGLCEGPDFPEKCRCAAGRTGPKCAQQCPGIQKDGATSCSGHGACLFNSKEQKAGCECKPEYVGATCNERCPLGLNKQICGKNGQCEADATGKAACKCLTPWRGHTCEHRCPGSTDTQVCSSHGTCNYDEEQKVTFCKCENGFLGKRCAVMCAKDREGRVCSGHGLCAPDGDEQAKCVCKTGWMGSDCAMECKKDVMGRVCGGDKQGTCVKDSNKGTTTCKCKKGFLGSDCNVKCPLGGDNVCSRHGTCFLDAATHKAKCVCMKGFAGDNCADQCPSSANGDVCNGHGTCSVQDGGNAVCACAGGFIGQACEHNCPGNAKSEGKEGCNGHGKCSIDNDKAVCGCEAGFMGPGCSLQCPKHKGTTCGGQGDCYEDKGVAKCKCKQGFMGLKCEHECPGRTKDSVCGGVGKCELGKEGQTKCLCNSGYGGTTCSESCPFKKTEGINGKDMPCFDKGSCVQKGDAMQCECKEGWLGKDCSIPCPTSVSGEICGNRGMCLLSTKDEDGGKRVQNAVNKAKCECKDGFVGRGCAQVCPTGDDGAVCSNHGKCMAHGASAICRCSKSHAGATCSKGCPVDKNGVICNGNGKCSLKDNSAQCECFSGFTGKDCETLICTTANSLFDSTTNRCLCERGYTCCSQKKLMALMQAPATKQTSEVQSGLEEFAH